MSSLIGEICFQHQTLPSHELPLSRLVIDKDHRWRSADGHCWLSYTCFPATVPDFPCVQPIISHCGRFSLVISGNIFNHQEVRSGLRFRQWRGHSDSETLVEGLAQRGPALLLELRGMFSFAAYDANEKQLLLGRDRLGIKPLYLKWKDGGLLFSSQRLAISSGPELSPQEISQVLAWGHLSTPATFPGPKASGVVCLPAGMVVRINCHRPHDPVRYWPPQPRPDWTPLPISKAYRARCFLREQLEHTVQQHLLADVPLACFLSSGLGSGALTALASRFQTGRMASFTVAFHDTKEDERLLARKMARHCGIEHHELCLDDDQVVHWLEAGLRAQDVPSAEGIKSHLVCQAVAGQGFKVALSGLGADEIFGGYPSHRQVALLRPLGWLPQRLRLRLLQLFSPRLAIKMKSLPHWDYWHLALALRRKGSDADLLAAGAEPLVWPESPPARITQGWGQISWAELFGYCEPMLLREADAPGMVSRLELRMPFLDHRLVEIALRLPQRFQSPGNGLLKSACADLFPPCYFDGPKHRYALPMARWMRGPLREHCRSRLQALQASCWLDAGWISEQWQAFEAGRLAWPQAWSLVVLGEFSSRPPLR